MNLLKTSELAELNISELRFIAWDTETTGTSTSKDYLVEIAAVAFDEDYELRSFETLIQPPCLIPENVSKIHGITNEMVTKSPRTDTALLDFLGFLSLSGAPRFLIAHNAQFDVGMLTSELARLNRQAELQSFQPEIVLDSCRLAKTLLPELPAHGLAALAKYFGIPQLNAHRAMSDVKTLQAVFLKLLSLAADRCARGQPLCFSGFIDLCGGYFLLSPADTKKQSFFLPPKLQILEKLCGSNSKIAIVYNTSEEVRYISPRSISMRGLRVYLRAFCHRDQIEKTFRADKIVRVEGKIED